MSKLLSAVKSSDTSGVAKAIKRGEVVNAMDEESGESVLALAASAGYPSIVRLLLEAGADPNFLETVAWPLSNAAGSGFSEIVELLIDYEADVDAIDEDANSALGLAAAGGHLAVVEQLVEAGANARQKCSFGRRPILLAAENGHATIVDFLAPLSTKADVKEAASLLKRHGRGPVSADVEKFHWAAARGELEVVERYLAEGMAPDVPCEYGETAASYAATPGRVDVLKRLRAAGANLAHVDDRDWCPLIYAAMSGSEAAYNYLFDLTPTKYQKKAEEIRKERTAAGMWKPEQSGQQKSD